MNKKTLFKSFIALFLLQSALAAKSITASSYANSEEEAKNQALLNLSYKISTNIESSLYKQIKSSKHSYKKEIIQESKVSSKLPLFAVKYLSQKENNLYKVSAKLDSKDSLPLYKKELINLSKQINNIKNIKSLNYLQLEELLKQIQNFKNYSLIASFLKASKLPTLKISELEIKNELIKKEKNLTSIKLAAKLLAKDIKQKDIYISAAKLSKTSEITQFSRLIKKELSSKLNTVSSPNNSKFTFRGTYEILKDSIYLQYSLRDKENNILKTKSVLLHKDAYKNTQYKAKYKSFHQAINSSFVKSNNLDVNIGFKGFYQENNIDLQEGDLVDIVLKSNKQICYFIVGHILREDKKFSYVLPLGDGNNPYISYLTGEDVNRFITIASEIPVSAPFGKESLQLTASTFKNSCSLKVPKCIENNEGYCVINKKPSEAIFVTRGLNFKKKKQKLEKTESIINFNSFAK